MVHGHRGARARLPENTLPGFEYAIMEGVDAIEMDLAVTRDNIVVVSHDPYLEPPQCTGPRPIARIRELTSDEVRLWECGAVAHPNFPKQTPLPGLRIPALEEVFALAERGDFDFSLEAKIFPDEPDLTPLPEEFASLVLALIRRHGLEHRVLFQSFDFRILRAMHNLAPEIRGAAVFAELPEGSDFIAMAREAGVRIVASQFRLATIERVRAAHEAGVEVMAWTPNTPADWETLISAQVDTLVSDDPAELIA